MTNPAAWTLRLITNNAGWKFLSLAIAVAIWMSVASEPELSTFATARIQFKNLPDDLELSSEPETTILLELRGPSGELSGMGDGGRHPSVILDMSGVGPGEHTFPIGPSDVSVPRGVRIVRATPSQVRFDFDRPRVRLVPVSVRFAGEGRNGYHVTDLKITPPKLEIVGPRRRVSEVESVVTDAINVGTTTGPQTVRVNTYVQDPFIRFQSPPQVTVSFTMKK